MEVELYRTVCILRSKFLLSLFVYSRVGKYKYFLGADTSEDTRDWLIDLEGKFCTHLLVLLWLCVVLEEKSTSGETLILRILLYPIPGLVFFDALMDLLISYWLVGWLIAWMANLCRPSKQRGMLYLTVYESKYIN